MFNLIKRQAPRDAITGYRFDGRAFSVNTPDGAVLRGVTGGDGPLVVLSHCWTGKWQVWESVATRLQRSGFSVMAYDHRGHGDSTAGTNAPTIEQLDADLALVLDHSEADQVVLAGHSLGGAVVLSRAIANDPRVAGVAVVSSSSAFIVPRPIARPLRVIAPLLGRRFATRAVESRLGSLLVRPSLGARPAKPAIQLTLDAYRQTKPEVIVAHFQSIIDFDVRSELQHIETPVAVMVGTRDRLTPQHHARTIQRSIPGATLVVADKAGHMLPLERPAEVAAQIANIADIADIAGIADTGRRTP